ncbi:MAG: LuxR C-terminal-related transcriptional regulator [Chloroflexota bacterium]|nr:LuxR C-terminal-related transcriptional regulator [Chloroflexota bacterium]
MYTQRATLEEALAELNDGAPAAAVARLRALVESGEEDVETRLLLGRALLLQGRVEDAGGAVAPLVRRRDLTSQQHALALAVTGVSRVVGGDPSASRLIRSAIDTDDPPGHATALAWAATGIERYLDGDLGGAVDAATCAYAATDAASRFPRAQAEVRLATMLMHADRFGEAEALLRAKDDVSDARSARFHRSSALGMLRFHDGGWDEAAVLLDPRPAVADAIEIADNDWALATGLLGVLYVHQDRLDDAQRLLGAALGPMAAGQAVMLFWAAALHAEAENDVPRAANLADRLVSMVERSRSFVRLRLFGPDLVRLALAVGDVSRAKYIADRLAIVAAVAATPSVEAAARLCNGLIHNDSGEIRRATELYAISPRPLDRAIALEAYAATFQTPDDPRAVAAERAALEIYRATGASRDLRRVRASLRHRGVTIEHRAPGKNGAFGWTALSSTEEAVARLVGDGLTNAEIARRLFISPRTVETHVAHLFVKLGVKSRAGVAAAAARATP